MSIILLLVYLVKPNKNADNLSTIMYGLTAGELVIGILVNRIYGGDMKNRLTIEASRLELYTHLWDIFGHILPFVIIYFIAPKKTEMKFNSIVLYLIFIFCLYLMLVDVEDVYVGVPNYIKYGLYPAIVFYSSYHKYGNK